ncbi:MAG TPA: 30S ribosomal protein S6, partial [Clostridia bacterium]|nr:30S ribosomal protein S6 [Clostridia bacterium]
MKRKYETIFIVDSSIGEEAVKIVVEKFVNLIKEAGEINKVDEWGNKRLAYKIKDKLDGYYVLVLFDADTEFPQELERIYKITEG